MEIIIDFVYHLWDGYLYYYLDQADPRVSEWPLMFAYWPTLLLTVLYLIMVYAGTRFMEKRKPLSCYWIMLVYNVSLVAINSHIFFELFTASRKLGYSWSCQPVNYTNNPDELRIARALWWYYITKLIEFLDTMFFVVRKKNNQITFLHVYHHATMFPIWWIGVKWVPGGQSFFGAMINSFIHVVMYSYYCLSALGPRVQKYLWWKKYLTILQLVQFVAGMFHSAHSIYIECPFPLWMQWALIMYGMTIFALFVNFYLKAYVKPKKTGDKDGEKMGKNIRRDGAEDCNGIIKNTSNYKEKHKSTNGNLSRRPLHVNNSHRHDNGHRSLRTTTTTTMTTKC